MPYCSRCGVEVDDNIRSCPLCNSPIQYLDENNKPLTYYPKDIPTQQSQKREFHKGAFLLLMTIIAFIPIAINISADLLYNHAITWSPIPVFAILSAYGIIFIVTNLYKYPISLGFALFADLSLFLFSLAQVIPGDKSWFLPLGLPITSIVFLTILVMTLFIIYSKRKGFNLFGVILITAAVQTYFIDLFVSRFVSQINQISLSWSLFVVFSCIPISLFFFYLHYIKRVPLKFKRIFHL